MEKQTYVSDKNVRRLEFPNIYSKHKRFVGLEEIQKKKLNSEAICVLRRKKSLAQL